MRLQDFDYDLPQDLIAQAPLDERDLARLMVVDKSAGTIEEKVFRDIKEYLRKGDCLVLNDTRVIPARLYARRATGGKVEIFLVDITSEKYTALVNPSRRIKDGETLELEGGGRVKVLGRAEAGRFVEFDAPISEVLKKGHVPLPPYISRGDNASDANDYQTIYAERDGATAAPTAGLHFTDSLLEEICDKGVSTAFVTLHTSYGSFAPVSVESVKDHKMHCEDYEITEETAGIINEAKCGGGRVVAVGTTSARVLETVADEKGMLRGCKGHTDLFIYPGYEFNIVDAMITNFHLPKSTLLMLVSALAGRDLILKAYKRAIESRFRFFSYGDAMMIF